MDNALLIIVLAVACISVGIVRIGTWAIQRRDAAATQSLREAQLLAQAAAEVAR
ncbi:hypothetical protein [Stenotrophomonas maltophilia]|uniref:hypothetical protein n=1 Tax=Stenotrophomonas maltophilia TaxID=40324 RepID=UPI001594FABC|nr:hypothetical protein [Stenotrophomonas maltophilia]